jgi:hypothetical protein
MSAGRLLAAACLVFVGASIASAQPARRGPFPGRGSVELSGGGAWTQGFDMASRTADLSRATPGDRFELFATESRLDPAAGAFVRLGTYLTRSVSVEGGVRYSRPTLAIRLFGDAESAPDEEATAVLSQYIIEGAVLWHARRAAFARGRGAPFLSVGGGQIRELHEGQELVEIGRQFHVSGGIIYRSSLGRRSAGLRGEAGIALREGGVRPGEGRQATPFAFGGVALLF